MRVITGRLGGRSFDAPSGLKTHPMSDKARGALFNALGDIEDLTVLDAFAGTGAISFEAVSRGAKSALAIDNDRLAQKVLAANIQKLGLAKDVKLITAPTGAWLSTNQGALFDIVIADPPYADLQPNLVRRLPKCAKINGIFVLSWPSSEPLPELDDMKLVRQRTYGDMMLAFYRRIA